MLPNNKWLRVTILFACWSAGQEFVVGRVKGSNTKHGAPAVSPPCVQRHMGKSHTAVHESAEKILARIVKRKPVVVPELKNVAGSVDLNILVDRWGTVQCIKPIRGHPLALQAAMAAVRDWRFKPLVDDKGNARSFFGILTVPLEGRDDREER